MDHQTTEARGTVESAHYYNLEIVDSNHIFLKAGDSNHVTNQNKGVHQKGAISNPFMCFVNMMMMTMHFTTIMYQNLLQFIHYVTYRELGKIRIA